MRHCLCILILATAAATVAPPADAADPPANRMQQFLKRFPAADTNGDGVLTVEEARDYAKKARDARSTRTARRKPGRMIDTFASLKLADLIKPGQTVPRQYSPVVLTGKQLPMFNRLDPKLLVAFRYADGGWRQIPVQVDQRAMKDYRNDVYGFGSSYSGDRGGWKPRSWRAVVYCDPATYTGADPDGLLDALDEVVFMHRDAGDEAPAEARPDGVAAGNAAAVTLTDPIGGETRHVYLFRSAGTLAADAGVRYVNYRFKLASGKPYKGGYNLGTGTNPERSTVETGHYKIGFSDRAIVDVLAIKPPAGNGADILDQRKALFAPGVPVRSVLTFSRGEGAFICNINGPVRAIRAWVGCNSGPLVEHVHIFYAQREEATVHLRVHGIGGLVSFIDYSAAAIGMTYHSNVVPAGVVIDGQPDAVPVTAPAWEMVTGAPGTVVRIDRLITNAIDPRGVGAYYRDEAAPSVLQVSGDRHAYGACGVWIKGGIADTQPWTGGVHAVRKVNIFAPTAPSPATAAALLAGELKPVRAKAARR